MQETLVQSLGQEDPLKKEMAIVSSILAWKNPKNRGAWWATVHGVAKSQHNWASEQAPILACGQAYGNHELYLLNEWTIKEVS